jgi:hypothetical protein
MKERMLAAAALGLPAWLTPVARARPPGYGYAQPPTTPFPRAPLSPYLEPAARGEPGN